MVGVKYQLMKTVVHKHCLVYKWIVSSEARRKGKRASPGQIDPVVEAYL